MKNCSLSWKAKGEKNVKNRVRMSRGIEKNVSYMLNEILMIQIFYSTVRYQLYFHTLERNTHIISETTVTPMKTE